MIRYAVSQRAVRGGTRSYAQKGKKGNGSRQWHRARCSSIASKSRVERKKVVVSIDDRTKLDRRREKYHYVMV